MTLVFVYGTLKRGSSNHHHMAGQVFIGEARTAAGFTLYGLEGYPGMVAETSDKEGVSGEVWSVDEAGLYGLDLLEGTAEGLYRRDAVPLRAPFSNERVEAYLYLGDLRGRPRLGSTWED